MIVYTIINIILTEVLFYLAELLIRHRKMSCLVSFLLGLYVLGMSFGGNVTSLIITITENKGNIEVITIILFFANLFYGYMRGILRIKEINRKYGNL